MNDHLPVSEHFHLKPLAGGVYAALARPEGQAACNGGFIDLGGRTAVVDTFLSPAAATDLRAAARQLTGRDPDLVLLTHHHFDHIWGNQAFPEDTCIFSSEGTRRAIQEGGADTLRQNRENLQAFLQRMLEQPPPAEEGARAAQAADMARVRQRLALIDTIRLRPPNMTTQGPVSFHGTRRRVEFIPYPQAHSPGNSVIFLPDDDVVFAGDLLFSRMHPFIGDGDPQVWIDVLGQIDALGAATVVPGHGALSTPEDLRQLRTYLQALTDLVREFAAAGRPADELENLRLPAPFDAWEPKDLLKRSLLALHQRYTA